MKPDVMMRFERLGQEELLRLEHLPESDRYGIILARTGLFEAHVKNVAITMPENGMLIGRCPACTGESKASVLTNGCATVAGGLVGSLVSGRWFCLTCLVDGTADDLGSYPRILSPLEPGGHLYEGPWFFRGPMQAQAEAAS